eukprot:5776557-Pyramimonas_sp.AAC.1
MRENPNSSTDETLEHPWTHPCFQRTQTTLYTPNRHPDKNGGTVESTQKFKLISEAFHFLKHLPEGRETYSDDDEDDDYEYDSDDNEFDFPQGGIPSFQAFFDREDTLHSLYTPQA